MSKARQLANLGNVYDDGALSNRNLIINGAANIQQRSAGTIVTSGSIYGPDRFRFATANMDNLSGTFTQNSDAPEGFGNSIKVTITTAESAIAADEYAYINQHVEAQNLQQLAYGTSAAKQVTLSFYVKSSVTGTFAVGLYKADNTAQIHNLTYTISSANTWEYKTVTFAANTLSGGEIDNDNGSGLSVNWHLAAGSDWKGGSSTSGWTSYANNTWADGHVTDTVITTTNATFQLTGVQLECSDTATPFEHRSFGDELARCQRYFCKIENNTGNSQYLGILQAYTSSAVFGVIKDFPAEMRTTPTVAQSGTFGCGQAGSASAGVSTTIGLLAATSRSWITTGWGGGSGLVAGYASVTSWSDGAYLTADAEL